jgi:hypothetical protein
VLSASHNSGEAHKHNPTFPYTTTHFLTPLSKYTSFRWSIHLCPEQRSCLRGWLNERQNHFEEPSLPRSFSSFLTLTLNHRGREKGVKFIAYLLLAKHSDSLLYKCLPQFLQNIHHLCSTEEAVNTQNICLTRKKSGTRAGIYNLLLGTGGLTTSAEQRKRRSRLMSLLQRN